MDELHEYINIILNKPIQAIGRSANMLWLGIGAPVKVKIRYGEEVEENEIALHVQSTWRIISNDGRKIILGSYDFYMPGRKLESSEDFEWDVKGNNLFDRKAEVWLENIRPIYIKSYKVNRLGDLILLLSNGERIEIYSNASAESESWRLFEVGSEKAHLVMNGTKFTLD